MGKPDKILAHELLGREVLNLQAGEVAGSVVDFGINRDGKVQLIGVLPTAWYSGGRGIAPSAITFLTGDRMCIANGEALQDFSPDGDNLISTDSGGQIYGKTVLLHDGDMLGELVDFRFNLGDGRITDLLVLDGEQRRTRVPIEKITTIGKDYIIIERASANADGDAAASEPGGEAAPFSGAAAAAVAPAAADTQPEPEEKPEPAPRGNARNRFKGKAPAVAAAPVEEPVADTPPLIAEMEPAAADPTPSEPEPEAEPAPAPIEDPAAEAAIPGGTNLDSVFSVPSTGLQQGELLDGLSGAPGAAETAAPAVATEPAAAADLFAERGVNVSKFDQKKLEFLRAKPAHRDIRDPDGIILVAQGETLDEAALLRIYEAGVLGEVFIEMTLKK